MSGLVVRSPGWAVSTLLHWRPTTVLLVGNAVPIGLTSVQNTGDRVAVKGRQEKLTHECVEGTLLTLDTAPSHVKMCRWLTSYVPRSQFQVL